MKKKVFAIFMAAVMVCTMSAFAAENASATDDEAAVEATEQSEADGAAAVLEGFYILNYAQAAEQVNLNIIAEPDLTAVAEQAGTTIYHFREDGSVTIYQNGTAMDGTFTADDGTLTIETEDGADVYSYEVIDGLMIIRDGDESSVLYDFVLEDMDYITIEDYSTLEIDASSVAISDEDIDSYINTVLQGQTTYEQITEGVTEDGDIVTISYSGVLDGEEEPFEGGSAEGLSLQLGSGALIDNFEEQLTGQEIGSTIEVAVIFPEDYSGNEDLAGKKAVFTTTIDSKTEVHTPQISDEWVQEFSAEYLPETLNTVEEFRTYSRGYLETYVLHAAMLNALAAKTTITGYNAATAQMLINYSAANLANNAAYYGYDSDTYASIYGYSSADTYTQAEAISYMNIAMIANQVLMDEGIHYTTEELDSALTDYMRLSGYASRYTLDEYKETVGVTGMWLYTNLEFKYDTAMNALEDRVVLTETETETEEAE